jgi:hypothetical protein
MLLSSVVLPTPGGPATISEPLEYTVTLSNFARASGRTPWAMSWAIGGGDEGLFLIVISGLFTVEIV